MLIVLLLLLFGVIGVIWIFLSCFDFFLGVVYWDLNRNYFVMYKNKWMRRAFGFVSFLVILSMVMFTVALGF